MAIAPAFDYPGELYFGANLRDSCHPGPKNGKSISRTTTGAPPWRLDVKDEAQNVGEI